MEPLRRLQEVNWKDVGIRSYCGYIGVAEVGIHVLDMNGQKALLGGYDRRVSHWSIKCSQSAKWNIS
jgi:hypothetical protein